MDNHADNVGDNSRPHLTDWFVLLPMDDVVYGKCPDMPSKDLKRIERAADDMLDIVARGMAAIGDLQWLACTNRDNQPDVSTFIDLADLQKNLAELVERLHALSGSAAYRVQRSELATKVATTT